MVNMDMKREPSYGTHWARCVIPFLCCAVDDTRSRDLAARLIIKYEDDYPLHVETQKDFDVVCNRDTDTFCQVISQTVNTKTSSYTMDAILVFDGHNRYFVSMYIFRIMVLHHQ